jgi:Questin oxidase-like
LSYYHRWEFTDDNDLDAIIEQLVDVSIYIYGATHKPDEILFDFFLLHLVTAMHAIRIFRIHMKDRTLVERMLQQYVFFALCLYTCQLRPMIDERLIDNYPIDMSTKNWTYVIERTLTTAMIHDVHAVKIIRVLRDADTIYGHKDGFYLRTAVKTVDHYNVDYPWIGRTNDEQRLNVLNANSL